MILRKIQQEEEGRIKKRLADESSWIAYLKGMTKAEINYFHPSTCSDQKVFWLNITMHNILLPIKEKKSAFT